MKHIFAFLKDILLSLLILGICFALCLVLQNRFKDTALVPAIFVFGTFLTSVITDGYTCGAFAALVSVLAVNFAFTFPFFKLNFTIPENIISAVILIVVTLITCGLTIKLKRQDAIKAESEKEKMRANLLRAVSHDLRTPLTTIYSSSSALLEHSGDFTCEQINTILHGIKEDSQWLSRMVENLLSITRLDNGNVKILKTDTALEELIDSVLVKFAKRYPNQEVCVDIPDELVIIPMDAILIEQVAVNILENAVQHAVGMARLSLKVFTASGKAVFEIADNGCGIEKDKLKTVFSGYYTNDTIIPDGRSNNAGIGLSVCAAIIKAHGGEIRAENAKDGGAVFRFTLNMEELDNEQ